MAANSNVHQHALCVGAVGKLKATTKITAGHLMSRGYANLATSWYTDTQRPDAPFKRMVEY